MNTWIIVAGEPGVKNLVETARAVGGQVRAVVVGSREVAEVLAASGVDEVCWINCPDEVPAEAYAVAVGEAVSGAPGVLIGGRRPAERVLLGAAAAALKAPVFTGATSITLEGDNCVVTHLAYGGISEQTVAVPGSVALVLDGGGLPAKQDSPGTVRELETEPTLGMVLEERSVSSDEQVDLASAVRVVGVGRGLRKQADLPIIEELASALRAEVGCSRPLSEGLDWLPRDRYIGISGQHIAPRLYFAVGLSGALQHLDGARDSEVIVSINSDPKAPIVEQADYVLVGDLYDLVPAVTSALNRK